MFNRQNDSITRDAAIDRGSSRPNVDMTSAGDLRHVFGQPDGQGRSEVVSNGQLSFDDPYQHGHSQMRHQHNDCAGDSDSFGDKQNTGKSNDQQLQQQILKLEQEIQFLLTELQQVISGGQGSVDASGQTASTAAAGDGSISTAGAINAINSVDTSSQGDNTSSTGVATQTGGDAGNSAGTIQTGGDSVAGTATTTAGTDASSATTTPVNIESVMAQSPNAAGPLNLDASVSNASMVGFIGPTAGATVDSGATAEIKDMKSYAHLKTGGWVQIEDQNKSGLVGGYWKDDWKGENTNMPIQNSQDDAVMNAPPTGYVDHFWLHDGGATIDGSQIDGFYSTAEAKASTPNSGLSASLGIDWFKPDGTENGQSGSGIPLTDQWQTLYHTTLDSQTLANDPPPGLTSTFVVDSSTASNSSTPGQASTVNQTGNQNSGGETSSTGAKLIDLFPQTDTQWQQATNDAPAGSLIISESSSDVNPKYDTTFNSIDPTLKQHIDNADAAGMKTLGYVGTANGTKSLAEAEAEIDDWYKNVDVKGIYLGNSGKADGSGYATDPASEQYFETLATYIKDKGGMAVINGSGTPVEAYANYFDVQGTVEDGINNYGNYPEAAWQANYSPDHFSAVLGGVQQSDISQVEGKMYAKDNGYIAVGPTYPDPVTDQYWQTAMDGLKQL